MTLVACPLARASAASREQAGEFRFEFQVERTAAGEQPAGGHRSAEAFDGLLGRLVHPGVRRHAQVVVAGEREELPAVDDRRVRHPAFVDQEVRIRQPDPAEQGDALAVGGHLGEALDPRVLLGQRGGGAGRLGGRGDHRHADGRRGRGFAAVVGALPGDGYRCAVRGGGARDHRGYPRDGRPVGGLLVEPPLRPLPLEGDEQVGQHQRVETEVVDQQLVLTQTAHRERADPGHVREDGFGDLVEAALPVRASRRPEPEPRGPVGRVSARRRSER